MNFSLNFAKASDISIRSHECCGLLHVYDLYPSIDISDNDSASDCVERIREDLINLQVKGVAPKDEWSHRHSIASIFPIHITLVDSQSAYFIPRNEVLLPMITNCGFIKQFSFLNINTNNICSLLTWIPDNLLR